MGSVMWKVDVGICPMLSPTSISDLIIIEKNRPFSLFYNQYISGNYSGVVSDSDAVSMYNSDVGDSGQFLYTMPYLFSSPLNATEEFMYSVLDQGYGNLFAFAPSIPIGYSKVWEQYKSKLLNGDYVYVFKFNQLNKVVTVRQTGYTTIYKINDGLLSTIYSSFLCVFPTLKINAREDLNLYAFTPYFCVLNSDSATYSILTNGIWYEIDCEVRNTGQCVYRRQIVTSPSKYNNFFKNLFVDGFVEPDYDLNEDPFNPGGNSGEGGGDGDFDNTSTPIEIPDLPSISAASTGFISLFNPSLSQLNELASYLWSDLFEIDGWKKLFADPMDAILGLSILPVAVPSGGIREVKVGNIGTGISLTIAASQFVEVDCGSIDVNEYWGAYLDYEPYTQAQIFLPYIGTRPISVDEIMGKTVRVVYHVDILTGACCCFVKCGNSVLYTYNGQCSIPIPITGANYTSVVNGVISIAASVGSLVATGGASAPIALPSIANSAVNQMKPQVEKSGSISGSAGVLNMQVPYLILIRPRQALPSKQNEFIGYPSLITVQLTELSGYTEVQSIHLENIPATQEELAEIQSLLEGGVIF